MATLKIVGICVGVLINAAIQEDGLYWLWIFLKRSAESNAVHGSYEQVRTVKVMGNKQKVLNAHCWTA